MVTTNQYAELSDNVYNDSGVPFGWAKLNVPGGINPNSGFYASAYQNTATGEIVIAIRGTQLNDAGDLAADAQIAAGRVPDQYQDAAAFYDTVRAQYGDSANIALTGHSLGGALASLLAAEKAADGVQATVFNALGVKGVVDNPDNGFNPNGDYSNVHNYNALFDPISNLPLGQIGKVNTVFVSSFPLIPDLMEPFIARFHPVLLSYFLLDQHSIDNLVNANFAAAQRWVFRRDPLTFDMDGDGIETVGIDPNNPILFDHDGDSVKTATGWVAPDDAFLVLDRNGNGTIDNGSELFGDSTPLSAGGNAADGFAALADLDSNGDGKVASGDTQFANLRLWRDLNQDGISQSGELYTLAQQNIASINVTKTENNTLLPDGNVLADVGSYTRTDGTRGTVGDIGHLGDVDLTENTFYSQFTDTVPLTPEAQLLPDLHGSGQVRDLREAASLSLDIFKCRGQSATCTVYAAFCSR